MKLNLLETIAFITGPKSSLHDSPPPPQVKNGSRHMNLKILHDFERYGFDA